MKSGLIENQFIGDNYYNLRLRNGEVEILQSNLSVGPNTLRERLLSGDWFLKDVTETLRLALIGAGLDNQKAFHLIKDYIVDGNVSEYVVLAAMCLHAYLFGAEPTDDEIAEAESLEDDPKKKVT